MSRLLFFGTILFLVSLSYSQQQKYSQEELFIIRASAPSKLWELFNNIGLNKDYEVFVGKLNPFYLWGDFDGDGKEDFVVQLLSRETQSDLRIAVLLGVGKVIFIERDDSLRYPGLTAWYVVPKYEIISQSPYERTKNPPTLVGDGFEIVKVEASSSLIYWNGRRFVSYWRGD
jgi:hypothetical protein